MLAARWPGSSTLVDASQQLHPLLSLYAASLTAAKGTVNTSAPPGLRIRRISCSAWYGFGTSEKTCGNKDG